MKRIALATSLLAVVAANPAFAQQPAPADLESGMILCVVEGSNRVVSAPLAECPTGIKKPTPDDLAALAKAKPSRITAFLDDTGLRANVKLLDLDLVEGLTFGAKYQYQVEKSTFRPSYFARVDRYVLGANIHPGTLLDGVTPISFGLSDESEILFVQQFDSGTEARKVSNGYLPKRLPINTAKVLSLKPGDYVRFSARLNAMIGAGQAFTTVPGFEASIGANYVVSGDFQVHVFRLDASRVRLKLVALRGDEKSLKAQVGVKGLELFGIAGAGKAFVRLSKLDEWFQAKVASSNSDLFMVDYVMDLADGRAANVYDSLFSSLKSVRTYQIANPLTRKEELATRLTSNVAALEELALDKGELRKTEPMDRAVNRLFKGSNSAYTKASAFRLGVLAARLKRDERYRRNFLTRIDIDAATGREIPTHYLVPTWNLQSEADGLIAKPLWGAEEIFRSANALFTATSDGVPIDFKNISFVRRHSDTKVSGSEYHAAEKRILSLLSASGREAFYRQVKDTGWANPRQVRSAQMDLEYFFHAHALTALFAAGWGQKDRLVDAIMEFLISQNEDWLGRSDELHRLVDQANEEKASPDRAKRLLARAKEMRLSLQDEVSQRYGAESLDLCAKLETMLAPGSSGSPRETSLKRFEALIALRASPLFRKVGPGFIVYLLKAAHIDVDEVLFVKLNMSAAGLPEVHVTSGVKENRDLYDVVEFLEAMLNGNDMDMRLAGPKNTNTTKVDYEKLLERVNLATN